MEGRTVVENLRRGKGRRMGGRTGGEETWGGKMREWEERG